MIFRLVEKLLTESVMDDEQIKEQFINRFGVGYMSFFDSFKRYSERKTGELDGVLSDQFINMVDVISDKLQDISRCYYNEEFNKMFFYNRGGDVVADCDCKDGLVAVPVRKNKFDLNEALNDNNQLSISFPLIVKYESEDPNISKDDIEGYQELEQSCIQKYADDVLKDINDNQKYVNEVLGTYDFELKYDGYDDNFNAYFILTTQQDDILDEDVLKAFKRYFNKEVQYEEEKDGNNILLTAQPIVTLNSNFVFEKI